MWCPYCPPIRRQTGTARSGHSERSKPAFHKSCSTIDRNTATKNATIKCVPCPLALCVKPDMVMGVFSLALMRFVVTRAFVPRLTCRDSRRKVGLPPAQYSRTLWYFAECWLRDFDLTSRHLEKPRPMRGRGCIGRGPLDRSRHPATDASPNLCKIAHFQTEPLGVETRMLGAGPVLAVTATRQRRKTGNKAQ